MLKISSALAAAFSLSAITGQNAFPVAPPVESVRKRDGHVYGTSKIGTPRRKRAGRVSARGHHNHAAYPKRARKRRIKKECAREVRQFIRGTFRDYCADTAVADEATH